MSCPCLTQKKNNIQTPCKCVGVSNKPTNGSKCECPRKCQCGETCTCDSCDADKLACSCSKAECFCNDCSCNHCKDLTSKCPTKLNQLASDCSC